MDLQEILASLRATDPDTLGEVPGMVDQIAQIVGDRQAGADAMVAELNEALTSRDAEIQRLQAENYKLMTAVGSASAAATEPADDPGNGADDDGAGDEELDINEYIKEED